ncbi:MAG: hypothetical protein K9J30_06810 [Bacteroidales bacterium]|nr:hypothetical protein [Bacteroidales bacterium]
MKHLIVITILLSGSLLFAQQQPDEILASNHINDGKPEQTLMASQFQNMNANELDGIYKLIAKDGQLKEVRTFKNGLMDGTWLEYDENKNLVAIANYKDNQKHGIWVIWDSNGTKRYELYYENGKRSGKWRSWDESGKLVSEKNY